MPTQASSTRELRNFKGQFRSATLAILRSGLAVPVDLERGLERLKCSVRTEIAFDLGPALDQQTLPSGKKVYDFFAATLRVRIVTGRKQNQSFPGDEATDLHEIFSSNAMDLLAEEKDPFTEALLPYYAVKTIMPQGSKSDLDVLYFEDFTDIIFGLQFGIRSTAWPAAYLVPA